MINKINNDEHRETKNEFVIREVEEKDMQDICDLHARCRKENFKWFLGWDYLKDFWKEPMWRRKHILEKKDEGKYAMFVYEKWWKILWFIDWWPSYDENYDFKIPWFYVDPNSQREWIWRKIWEYLLNSEYFKNQRSFYLRTFRDNLVWGNFYKKMWGRIVNEKKESFGEKEYELVCYARKK